MSAIRPDGDDAADIDAIENLVERAVGGEPLDDILAELPPDIGRQTDVLLEAQQLFVGLQGSRRIASEISGRDRPSAGNQSVPGKDHVGSYALIELLGRGGQGEVWLAVDERLGRRVALKLLNDHSIFSREARRRLLREAVVISRLDHPGICTVHEVGEDGGVPFIAMRLVEGKTLDSLFRISTDDDQGPSSAATRSDSEAGLAASGGRSQPAEHRLPGPEEILRLILVFEEAARALHFAHEAGVVHRDIKPRNIMVTDSGQAVLLDFGLARHEEIEASLTRTGDLFGTPAYMSPEQLSRGSGGADRRTDIWSLGVTLYECLTLARPFAGPTRDALYQSILTKEPEPPRRVNRAVSRDLATVVSCCLEKDCDHRYQTALALAEDLRRVRTFEPIHAKPAGPLLRLRRWAQRNPALATAVGGLFAVLVIGLAVALMLLRKSERERTAKEKALREVTAERNEKQLALTGKTAALSAKEAALSDYHRLGDLSRLQRLQAQADLLWPCEPTKVPVMQEWVKQATALANELDGHKALLHSLRRAGRIGSPESNPGDRRPADSRPFWLFATDSEQFKHDTTEKLVADLNAFVDPDPHKGLLADMRSRLAFSESVERATIRKYETQWADAIRSIADKSECPKYDGLRVGPELGLIPIGRDPASGLWEFAHLQTTGPGADPIPNRSPDGKLVVTESLGLVFVLLPGGTFRMGAIKAHDEDTPPSAPNVDPDANDTESPVHEVTLEPFFMSKYEMTQGQWLRLVGRNPSCYPPGERFGDKIVDLRNPVERVSWEDCNLWLGRLGLLLPTEAQWEYAARGGTTTPTWTGIGKDGLAKAANLADAFCRQHGGRATWIYESWDDGYSGHAPVGSFASNPFGLHDVLGNVMEWCRDCFAGYDRAVDPGDGLRRNSATRNRVLRGGGFFTDSSIARSAFRFNYPPELRDNYIGARPARSVSKH